MTTSVPTTSEFTREVSTQVSDKGRRGRDRSVDEANLITGGGGFASLVDTVRASVSASASQVAADLSSEVFEAGGQSVFQQQEAALEAQRRNRELSGQDDARFDRAGVSARLKSASEGTRHSGGIKEMSQFSDSPTTRLRGAASEGLFALHRSSGQANQAAADLDSNPLYGTSAPGERGALSAHTMTSHGANPTLGSNTSAVAEPAIFSAEMATSPAGRQAVNPAQQVGQLLSAQRSGQPASVRGASPVAASPSGHPVQADAGRAKDAGGKRVSENDDQPRLTKEVDQAIRSDFSKLVRSLKMQLGGQHSRARLHLRPPELGRVVVDVRMDGDAIQIDVQAETEEGRQLLERRAGELRLALQQAGVVLDRLDVIASNQPADFDGANDANGADGASSVRKEDHALDFTASPALEEGQPWREQPEELIAAAVRIAGRKSRYSNRARLDVRA